MVLNSRANIARAAVVTVSSKHPDYNLCAAVAVLALPLQANTLRGIPLLI